MENLLTLNDKKEINKWIGRRVKYTLLFKASKDKCSANVFHNKCDNKGPTVTVLYDIDKSVYGGYTAVSWDSSGSFKTDSYSFLFILKQNDEWNPVQMKVKKDANSIFCEKSHGPTFGGVNSWFWKDHDLKTFSGKVDFEDTYFSLNGSTKFALSYTISKENYTCIANGLHKVKDIEVYSVEAYAPMLTEPWTSTPEWNTTVMDELKDKIQNYQPKKSGVPQANCLMIGQVAAGKSSFFNTLNSIFKGRITAQASAGQADQSVTTAYHKYQIKTKSDEPLNVILHDTKGLEGEQGELDESQISYLLDGKLPDKYKFNSSVPISSDTPGIVESPNLCDKIHCVAIVVDGSTAAVMPDEVKAKIKNIQIQIRQREIPQVVLLTKIDKICENTAEDLSKVYYSPLIEGAVKQVAEMMGLPRSHILPVRNYESERELNDHINVLALTNLQQILNFADDYM